jgi:SH3-like domain-containing protein
MTTAQHLRQFPAVWPVDGLLLPVGTRVTGTGKLTTHWRQVRTQGGQTGWVLRGNTRAVPARAVQDFLMTTAQHLRRFPVVWPVTGPLLPVGTRVKGTGRLTTHWRQVRTQGGQTGWVLRSNTRAVPATPVAATA